MLELHFPTLSNALQGETISRERRSKTRGLSSGGVQYRGKGLEGNPRPGVWMTGRPKRTRPCLTAQASQFPNRSAHL